MNTPDAFGKPTGEMTPQDESRSSAGPDRADRVTRSAIRRAVQQCAADDHDGLEELRRCARVARVDGLKPEHVVLLIHSAFDDYRGTRRDTASERDRKRLHLSSVALDAYFADD